MSNEYCLNHYSIIESQNVNGYFSRNLQTNNYNKNQTDSAITRVRLILFYLLSLKYEEKSSSGVSIIQL